MDNLRIDLAVWDQVTNHQKISQVDMQRNTGARTGSTLSLHGRTWYHALNAKSSASSSHPEESASAPGPCSLSGNKQVVRGVLDDYKVETLGPLAVVVCMMDPTGRRLFTVFRTVADFYNFSSALSADHRSTRCFYEVCFDARPQRLRFDIDIPHATADFAERVLGDFVQAMVATFEELRCPLRSIADEMVLCTSHGLEKRSYHVVFVNVFVNFAEEAKGFYSLVVRKMQPENQVFVDIAVYGKKQQFRLLGFSKVGVDRPKICPHLWQYRIVNRATGSGTEEIVQVDARATYAKLNEFQILKRTLISCVDSGSPLAVPVDRVTSTSQSIICVGGTPSSSVMQVLVYSRDTLAERYGFPFEFIGSSEDNTLILLRRSCASLCPTCSRVHEHENPFLRLVRKDDTHFEILFDCRRAALSAPVRQFSLGVLELLDMKIPCAAAGSIADSVESALTNWRKETVRKALEHEPQVTSSSSSSSTLERSLQSIAKSASSRTPTKRASSKSATLKYLPAHRTIVDMIRSQSKSSNGDSNVVIIDEEDDAVAVAENSHQRSLGEPLTDSAIARSVKVEEDNSGCTSSETPWKSSSQHNSHLTALLARVTPSEETKLHTKLAKLMAAVSSNPEERYFASSTGSMLSAFWKVSRP